MAELWLLSPWEVAWFNWEPLGTKGDPLLFICNKNIQNQSRNCRVMAIFPPERLCDSIETNMVQRGILWCSFLPRRSKIGQEMAESWPFSPLRDCVTPFTTTWYKSRSFGIYLDQKDAKSVKKWPNYGHFPPWEVAWFHWEQHGTNGDLLLFICNKKIQNRWINDWVMAIFPPAKLRDSIENHMGQKGNLWCSFVPKRFKIGQEIAEL